MINIVENRSKVMSCKFMENMKCNFRNSADCKYHQNGNPEECILYQLIEDNEKLTEKVQSIDDLLKFIIRIE